MARSDLPNLHYMLPLDASKEVPVCEDLVLSMDGVIVLLTGLKLDLGA
jgi:hypothetical protein